MRPPEESVEKLLIDKGPNPPPPWPKKPHKRIKNPKKGETGDSNQLF